MGLATEELAAKSGPGIGGLLNVTFGNAPELIIALIRSQRRPAGGREGLDRRLDHRQHPARARRIDARRRAQARSPNLQQPGSKHPGDDALPRGWRVDHAGDLRARRGPGSAEPNRRARQLRLDGGEALAGDGDRPHRHLRRRPVLLAAHSQGPVQPSVRGGARGGLRLERAALGHLSVHRRSGGGVDVRGPGRLDQSRPRSRSASRSSSSA